MIGIYGDSFTDINPIELRDPKQGRLPWPLHLARLQNQKIDAHGHSATSTWWSYKKFLKTYHNYSTIVFGYSNWDRWNNINYGQFGGGQEDFVGPLSHIFHADQINYVPDKMKGLAWKLIQVHPYLYDEQFNIFVYQSMFDHVNTLCKAKGIRIVNVMPFEGATTVISLDRAAGPCFTNLLTISGWETCDHRRKMVFPEAEALLSRADRRFCHINPHNNRVLADIISHALDNKTMGCTDLVTDPRWSYDPVHLQYLIDEL